MERQSVLYNPLSYFRSKRDDRRRSEEGERSMDGVHQVRQFLESIQLRLDIGRWHHLHQFPRQHGHDAFTIRQNVVDGSGHHATTRLAAGSNSNEAFLSEALDRLFLWRQGAVQDCVKDIVTLCWGQIKLFGLFCIGFLFDRRRGLLVNGALSRSSHILPVQQDSDTNAQLDYAWFSNSLTLFNFTMRLKGGEITIQNLTDSFRAKVISHGACLTMTVSKATAEIVFCQSLAFSSS